MTSRLLIGMIVVAAATVIVAWKASIGLGKDVVHEPTAKQEKAPASALKSGDALAPCAPDAYVVHAGDAAAKLAQPGCYREFRGRARRPRVTWRLLQT